MINTGDRKTGSVENTMPKVATVNEGLWGGETMTSAGVVRFDGDGIAQCSEEQAALLVEIDTFYRLPARGARAGGEE
jgi:hypothetical protein